MNLNKNTVINASGSQSGGSIELDSPLPVDTSAVLDVSGVTSGSVFIPFNMIPVNLPIEETFFE